MIWGELTTVWKHFLDSDYAKQGDISYIGCLSTEERSLVVAKKIAPEAKKIKLFYIKDADSRYEMAVNKRIEKFSSVYKEIISCEKTSICEVPLFSSTDIIYNHTQAAKSSTVVLDISALPKRFFFLILKFLLEDRASTVRNIFVIYASPQQYYQELNLIGDYLDWNPLPLFDSDNPRETEHKQKFYITGAGYMPMSFRDKTKECRCCILFPFPADLDSHVRSWNFVYKILEDPRNTNEKDITPISVHDVPSALKRIRYYVSQYRQLTPILAPYGPKTFSLAMCLYALQHEIPIYYTQPTAYHPDYSQGYKNAYMYVIKLDGENKYLTTDPS